MNVLEQIFAHKRDEVAQRRLALPLDAVERAAREAPAPHDFIAALRRAGMAEERRRPALIAEIKRASPSRGLLVEDFDPLRLARIYIENGASAISVLTDERFFQGHLDHLRAVSCLLPRLPLLRKDFIFDPYQVYEARAAGADALLLITAMLAPEQLGELQRLARSLGMAALVEIHDPEELETALKWDASLIGINNRDLRDFSVRLETSLALRSRIPGGVCVVAESGIHTPGDVDRLAQAGVDAILVGEALVTAPDVAEAVRRLSGRETAPLQEDPAGDRSAGQGILRQ